MTTFPWSRKTAVPYSDKGYRLAQGYCCPECGARSRVVDSRDASAGIRRRRVCTGTPEHRFTTYELSEAQMRALTEVSMIEKVGDILMGAVMEINAIRRRSGFKAVTADSPTREPRRKSKRAA